MIGCLPDCVCMLIPADPGNLCVVIPSNTMLVLRVVDFVGRKVLECSACLWQREDSSWDQRYKFSWLNLHWQGGFKLDCAHQKTFVFLPCIIGRRDCKRSCKAVSALHQERSTSSLWRQRGLISLNIYEDIDFYRESSLEWRSSRIGTQSYI